MGRPNGRPQIWGRIQKGLVNNHLLEEGRKTAPPVTTHATWKNGNYCVDKSKIKGKDGVFWFTWQGRKQDKRSPAKK